jgi:hypothetical protein
MPIRSYLEQHQLIFMCSQAGKTLSPSVWLQQNWIQMLHEVSQTSSTHAQHGPATVFLTSKISYLLFLTPPTRLKLGLQNLRDYNSNAPGQIKPSRQSTAAGLRLCCAFLPVSTICGTMLGQNHIAETTQHVLTFLRPKFVIYCTSGVALTNLSMTFSSTIGHCISIKF